MNDIFVYKYKTEEIGRNPKDISKLTYVKYGIPVLELVDVIRERCADCKVTELAIRKCNKVRCSSWPYRLGINPFVKPDKPYKKPDPIFKQSLSRYCMHCGESYMATRSDQKYCSNSCKKTHEYYVYMSRK
jgi:hypothetical protein